MSDDAINELTFDDKGLIPAITIDDTNGQVLMVAWMNAESLKATIETGKTHYWSRSRQKYWMKGESSGHTQEVLSISTDCDKDVLLIRVTQHGGACHKGFRSCFSWHLSDGQWIEQGDKVFDPDNVYDK